MTTVSALWSAIPWSWVGISALCLGLAAAAFWLGRIESGIWFLVAAVCTGYVGAIKGQRDYFEQRAEDLSVQVDVVAGERDNWRDAAGQCSAAAMAAKEASDRREKAAAAALKAAQARVDRAEAETSRLAELAAKPPPDATCVAAVRDVMEVLR